MNKIIEQVKEWTYLQQLPAECAGFRLSMVMEECGTQYCLFSYDYPEAHRQFTVFYDSATKDYLAKVTVGLTEYYDVNFIVTDLTLLEQALSERLERTLAGLHPATGETYGSIFAAKKILEWPYAQKLPHEAQGFELFISPLRPVKGINGSYIVIDYSDFATASNLIVYYNIYRDEFFGEVRIRQTPEMTAAFDANELPDLAAKLEASLLPVLASMRNRLK